MIGRPAPAAHFRRDNLVGGVIILLAAALPQIGVRARRHRPMRRLLPVVGWIAAVGCCTHALTLVILRGFSLTGVHPTHYLPGIWLSLDRRYADLQDVFFNEPWFFVSIRRGKLLNAASGVRRHQCCAPRDDALERSDHRWIELGAGTAAQLSERVGLGAFRAIAAR